MHALHAPTGQSVTFGTHAAPIRALRFVDVPNAPGPIIATGSWDKTVRYWDVRNSASPLATLACPERVYAMDTAERLLVIATADRQVCLVDLAADPAAFLRKVESPLKHQTRAITAFPDGKGWAMGSIEGRASLNAVDLKDKE